jgi:predicted DNA-binding transcriptional regulator YafY
LRDAIRKEVKVALVYGDEKGALTSRVIWPIGLAFYEGRQTVAAWCELRDGFRHFRTDRIREMESRTERYPTRKAVLVKQWREEQAREAERWEREQKAEGVGDPR